MRHTHPSTHHRATRPHRLAAALAGLALFAVALPEADARSRPRRASSFSANKEFGLGLMIGHPTGLSGKYYLSADTAVDFGLGVVGGYGHRSGLHLHADFLWHPAVLVTQSSFVMPLYFGVGGRFWDFDDDRDDRYDDDTALGVRVPLGIALDFNNVPLDVFFELAFVLDFFVNDGGAHGGLAGAIGVRYYFQ